MDETREYLQYLMDHSADCSLAHCRECLIFQLLLVELRKAQAADRVAA